MSSTGLHSEFNARREPCLRKEKINPKSTKTCSLTVFLSGLPLKLRNSHFATVIEDCKRSLLNKSLKVSGLGSFLSLDQLGEVIPS